MDLLARRKILKEKGSTGFYELALFLFFLNHFFETNTSPK